jgi:hypothetical protein
VSICSINNLSGSVIQEAKGWEQMEAQKDMTDWAMRASNKITKQRAKQRDGRVLGPVTYGQFPLVSAGESSGWGFKDVRLTERQD